jgi:hypothetical protein
MWLCKEGANYTENGKIWNTEVVRFAIKYDAETRYKRKHVDVGIKA